MPGDNRSSSAASVTVNSCSISANPSSEAESGYDFPASTTDIQKLTLLICIRNGIALPEPFLGQLTYTHLRAENGLAMAFPKHRVLMEEGDWTPFRNEIFDNWGGKLQAHNAAALYAVLYDRAYHHARQLLKPIVSAAYSDLANWSGLDSRVVKMCLKELRDKGLVHKEKAGTKGSRTDKPVWKVPLATRFLTQGGVTWTPVPRFLVREYIPVYANSVLLLFMLRFQSYNWLDKSWPGILAISGKCNWSESRVREALEKMSDRQLWKKIAKLPRPLTRKPQEKGSTHSTVRAVRYENGETVRPRKEFAKYFGIKTLK